MKIGITLRNMGPQSTPDLMEGCAFVAEEAGLESVWITDHIAIPPDDAEGSGGRYLDTLTGLAWLAGVTKTIKLGSGVLILPYRPALPTAKQVATVQELSKGRLLLGVGIGWMDPEFRALGVDRHKRGEISDEYLKFINDCFSKPVVQANGQEFLFKPCPPKPPILIGGRAPYALERAAKYGDGWLPMTSSPDKVEADIVQYRQLTDKMGKPKGDVTVMTGLPLDDIEAAKTLLNRYEEIGVNRLVCAVRYDTLDEYQAQVDRLQALKI